MTLYTVPRSRARRYQAHPTGDQYRRARQTGEVRLGLAAQAIVAGIAFAGFLLALPFVGLVLGAALGVDMTVLP